MGNPVFESIKNLAPGLAYKGATGHVFQLRHMSHKLDTAWCTTRQVWTSIRMGKVYTYNEAVDASIAGGLPSEGRWHAIGQLLYSVE